MSQRDTICVSSCSGGESATCLGHQVGIFAAPIPVVWITEQQKAQSQAEHPRKVGRAMPFGRMFWAGVPIVLVVGGITYLTAGKKDKATATYVFDAPRVVTPVVAKVKPPPPPPMKGSFVALTGVGDDEMVSQGFALSSPMDVRVYAMGEGDGEMYDYGWIMDAATREVVWRMEYDRTEHAGGARKNRVIDEVITLDAGNYMVYYVSDGSHSWSAWNSSAPTNQDAWGITLLSPSGAVDTEAVGEFEVASDPLVLAQLIGMRDDENRSYKFGLDEETRVGIYALGEGTGGEMYDFAWIQDARTGRTLWEMTYGMTEHAGGGEKNRMFKGSIVLPAGDYVLRYRSDGSHSLEDWNVSPPNDPAYYGVTVRREER